VIEEFNVERLMVREQLNFSYVLVMRA